MDERRLNIYAARGTLTMRTKTIPARVDIRWMIRRDYPDVLRIENPACRWSEVELHSVMMRRVIVGMVAMVRDKVVGFMVYELRKSGFHLMNVAVHSDYRRQRIGSQLLNRLACKLHSSRTRITINVPDSCDGAHVWLRENGYRATKVIHSRVADEYVFEFAAGKECKPALVEFAWPVEMGGE